MATPVYVKIEKYAKVQAAIDKVKKRIEDAKTVHKRINELKDEEDREISSWQSELSKIETKIAGIESTLKPK